MARARGILNIPEDFEDDEDEDMQFDIMFQDDRRDAENQESLDGDDNASSYSQISQPIDTRRQRSTSANTSAASSATRVTDFNTVSNTNTATSNTGFTVRRSGQPTGDRVGRPTGSQGKRRRKKVARKRYRPYGSHTVTELHIHCRHAAVKNYLTSGMDSQEDEQGMDDGVNDVADTD